MSDGQKWACPKCGSANELQVCVVIRQRAFLTQTTEDDGDGMMIDNFETELDDSDQQDHEWDGDSEMFCSCSHTGKARTFEVEG